MSDNHCNEKEGDNRAIPQTMGGVLYPTTTSLSSLSTETLATKTSTTIKLEDGSCASSDIGQDVNMSGKETNLSRIQSHRSRHTIAEEEKTYPEGGVRAWSIVFGAFAIMVSCFGYMNSIGVFQLYLSINTLSDYSEGTIGWIFSVYVFLSFFGGIFVGPVFDAYGPHVVLIPGSIAQVLAIMLLGVCTKYWHFMIVFGVLNGIATSMLFTPAVAIIAHWFKERRGYATGVGCTGGSIGGIIFPLILQSLIPKIGFAWATRVLGFISILLFLIGNLILRSRFYDATPKKRLLDFAAFKDIRFTLTTVGVFMLEFALFVPVSYISSYALAYGANQSMAYRMLVFLNVGSVLGRWLPGLVADKIGRFNTMLITTTFCFIVTLAIWLPAKGSIGATIAFAVLFGFGSGTGISLTPVCVAQICNIEDYGKRYGTCYFFVSFGALCGIPIAGSIVSSQNGSYDGLILFTGLCYIGSNVCFLAARIIGGGKSWRTIY